MLRRSAIDDEVELLFEFRGRQAVEIMNDRRAFVIREIHRLDITETKFLQKGF